jgi:hypothetical protein
VARSGSTPFCRYGPRFIERAETLLGPATQLSVVLDGDCIWGANSGTPAWQPEIQRENAGSCAVVNGKGARERAFPYAGKW